MYPKIKYTCGPRLSHSKFVFNNKIKNLAAVILPQVQPQPQEGRVGHDEVLSVRRPRRPAAQRPGGKHLAGRALPQGVGQHHVDVILPAAV